MLNDKNPLYWLEIANHDIQTVKILLRENGYADIIIYHMHQAIEKKLKSNIVNFKKDFPFIHDLKRLLINLSELDKKYNEIENEIIILHSFYVNLRYPQSENINQNDLILAKESFEKILIFFEISF